MFTRRDFAKIAMAAVPAATLLAKPNSKVHGVMIGVQSYSFRDRGIDEALKAMTDIGFSYTELYQGHIEPPKGSSPEYVKKWRNSPDTVRA